MNPPRVVVVTLTPRGGAGSAARRSQLALLGKGASAKLLARRDALGGPDGILVAEHNLRLPRGAAPGQSPEARWESMLRRFPDRMAKIEMFTDTFGDVALETFPEVADADVVHLHWVAGVVDIPSLPGSLAGKQVFWTMHDMNPFTGGCHYSLGCRRFETGCGNCPQLGSTGSLDVTHVFWRHKRKAYQALDLHMIAPSRWLADTARRSPALEGVPVSVVPNPVPVDVFRPYPSTPVRQSLGIPVDRPLIAIGAGYDVPRKGFAHLKQALSLLCRQYVEPFHLLVFGILPTLPRDFPEHRCHSLGSVDRPDHIAAILSACDCFVIPSVEDNLPNLVLEALACGTPVVGFRTGGIPDMVEHEKTGYLAALGDDADLARGIARVLSHPNRKEMSSLCRFRVLRDFSPEHHADRLFELYAASKS